MMMPKHCLTFSIQGPTRGNNAPADAPMTSSGTPKPSPIENNAAPPSKASPVWLMYSNAPARGGATQGPTMTAETAPMIALEYNPVPCRGSENEASRVCTAAGMRNS